MKTAIVGYTGFVGGNLCDSHKFDACYNSKNIEDAFGTEPDLLVYSGVRAEMFLANKFPEKDLEIIENAIDNIRRINPRNVVLISSIAVYNKTFDVDENTIIDKDASSAYGKNRRILEEWVEHNYNHSLIIRLPGIYGLNLKKNFLYDMIHIIPSMLTEEKYFSLSQQSINISNAYESLNNGFYKCNVTEKDNLNNLKEEFKRCGFSALSFTDSRGIYQYYNLKHLWNLIATALDKKINVLNVAVEPITAKEIYEFVYPGVSFVNELDKPLAHFDFRTKYANLLGGRDGYLMDKNKCLSEIKDYILASL